MNRPLAGALLFQGGVLIVGTALALLLGLRPWQRMEPSVAIVLISLIATLPMLAMLLLLRPGRWRWLDELAELVRQFIQMVFTDAPRGAVFGVAVLAGLGEELLFRGVIQQALSDAWSPAPAILAASLLFGLAHAVSMPYFLFACLIGLYLGGLYHFSGNLLVPILVHSLYDWVAIHYYRRQRLFLNPE